MARRLTPLGLFVKWIAAPLALAALGYFVVGPTLGADPKFRERAGTLRKVVPKSLLEKVRPKPRADGPSVDVTVRPAATEESAAEQGER